MKLAELPALGRGLLLAGITLVLCALLFALGEAAVRVRALLKYGYVAGVESTLTRDATSGLRIPVPGLRKGPIEINSRGFRSPEISVSKPPGTIRVAFLGGSTTYCAEVSSNAATWPAVVTRSLAAAFPGATFDYVNAGAPGYGLGNLLVNLEKRIALLEPDVIVIYEATNDLSGNSFHLAKEQGVVNERPDKERFWLSDYSLLVRLVELNLSIKARQAAVDVPTGKLKVDRERLEAPFRANLERLVVAARGVAPVVAVTRFAVPYRGDQPREVQVKAADSSLFYMPYMTIDTLLDAFDGYNEVISDVAARNGVLLIDGEDEIPGDSRHFTDSVHFNDAGSAAMAGRVSRRLGGYPPFLQLVASRART